MIKPIWYTLDEDKNPIPTDITGAAELFEDENRRVVAQHDITCYYFGVVIKNKFYGFASQYFISTVFLGIDHQFGDGPPILWETMVFRNRDDMNELFCARYETYKSAKMDHNRLAALLRAGKNPKNLIAIEYE